MKILVFGAGVIGTLYAARLQDAGHRVTILARSSRLADIRRYGLVLEDVVSGARSITRGGVTDRLSAEDAYDIALITVRWDQLAGILPDLVANRNIRTLVFMLNNPMGSVDLINALGADRMVLGFPGAGGTLEGHIVRYTLIAQQPTTIGEPDGSRTNRLRVLEEAFCASGLKTPLWPVFQQAVLRWHSCPDEFLWRQRSEESARQARRLRGTTDRDPRQPRHLCTLGTLHRPAGVGIPC